MKAAIRYFVILVILSYLLRYEVLVSEAAEQGIASFVGGVVISLALLTFISLYGLCYLFLQSMVYPGISHFARNFVFSVIVPAWLSRYDFGVVTGDSFLLVSYGCFVFLFTLGGRLLANEFVGYVAKIEYKKGKAFPSVAPEKFVDLVPYHIMALLFVLMPVFAKIYWSAMTSP